MNHRWSAAGDSNYEKLFSQRKKGHGFTAFDLTFTDGFVASFKSKWIPKDTFKEKDYLSILMAVKIAHKLLKDFDLFDEVETNMTTEKFDHLIEDTYQQSSDYMTVHEILKKHHVEYGDISAHDDSDLKDLIMTRKRLAIVITANNRAFIVGTGWMINCFDGEFIYFSLSILEPSLEKLQIQTCLRLRRKEKIGACPDEFGVRMAMGCENELLLDWFDAFPSLLEREHFPNKKNIFHLAAESGNYLESFELIRNYIKNKFPSLPNMEFDADEDGLVPYMSVLYKHIEPTDDYHICKMANLIEAYLDSGISEQVLAAHWHFQVKPNYYDLALTGLLEFCYQNSYTTVKKFLTRYVLQNSLLLQQKCYGTALRYQYIDTARHLLESYPDLYKLHMERDINTILRKRSAEKDHISSTKKAK